MNVAIKAAVLLAVVLPATGCASPGYRGWTPRAEGAALEGSLHFDPGESRGGAWKRVGQAPGNDGENGAGSPERGRYPEGSAVQVRWAAATELRLRRGGDCGCEEVVEGVTLALGRVVRADSSGVELRVSRLMRRGAPRNYGPQGPRVRVARDSADITLISRHPERDQAISLGIFPGTVVLRYLLGMAALALAYGGF